MTGSEVIVEITELDVISERAPLKMNENKGRNLANNRAINTEVPAPCYSARIDSAHKDAELAGTDSYAAGRHGAPSLFRHL